MAAEAPPFAFVAYADAAVAGGGVAANYEEKLPGGFSGVLHLLPKIPEDQRALFVARGLPIEHVPLEAPYGLTRANADAIVAAAGRLGPRILFICATANRASAAYALVTARAKGWSGDDTFRWAAEQEPPLKFLTAQPLRNFVARSLRAPGALPADRSSGLLFRQLFEPVTSTYTYLLADPDTREAVLLDPVVEKVDRDAALIMELELTLVAAIETHVHADHITAGGILRQRFPTCKTALAAASSAAADICLSEGDVIRFGARALRVLSTPGHTNGCLSFVLDDDSMVFTGDALFVRGCGRTDFQQGSSSKLYDSITTKIFSLPDSTRIYPGHDYNGNLFTTVGEEKELNPRIGAGRTKADFEAIMSALKLAAPKQLDVAVPANMVGGVTAEHKEVMEVGRGLPSPCRACVAADSAGAPAAGDAPVAGGGGAAAVPRD